MFEWLKNFGQNKAEKLKNLTSLKLALQKAGYNIGKMEVGRIRVDERTKERSYMVWVEKSNKKYKIYPDDFSLRKKKNVKPCRSLTERIYIVLSAEFGQNNVKRIRKFSQ